MHYDFLRISSVPLTKGLYIDAIIIFLIEAYYDAGYIGDKGDQKSSTRYYIFVGGNLVTWQKQKVVSCLSAEAEY